MIYYITFACSSFFIWLSEYCKKRQKILQIIFGLIGILILAGLAGVRNYNIGTDTLNYNNYFYAVRNYPNYIMYAKTMNYFYGLEPAFSFLDYVCGYLFKSPHSLYFFSEFIICANVYTSLLKMHKHINVVLGWITFCFLFYTTTFNILRQSIAFSIVLLGIIYLFNGKKYKSFVCLFFACLFHISAIISFTIYIMGCLLYKVQNVRQRRIFFYCFVFITILLPSVINKIYSLGFFNDKYSQYINDTAQVSLLSTIGIRLPMILVILYVLYKYKNIDNNILFIFLIMVQEFMMLPLQGMSAAVGRLMLYFGISKVVGYPLALNILKKRSNGLNFFLNFTYLLMLAIIFYYQVIINNNNQVYPFTI